MKLVKRMIFIAIVSLFLAGMFYYLTDGVVKSTWAAMIAEIGTITLVIFIFAMIAYVIAKSVVKGTMAVRKKKPSDREGL